MGYIVSNFESFADVYIRCLVTAYIFSMAVILGLWMKPFVQEKKWPVWQPQSILSSVLSII